MTAWFSMGRRTPNGKGAFTLVELMIAMTLFFLIIGGVIYSHITGLKMYELTKAKLGASNQTRVALGLLTREVQSAKSLDIGTMNGATFTPVPDGSPQQGNALQIYQTTNTGAFIQYYLDPGDKKLKRATSASRTLQIVAENLTNTVVFTSEDYAGTVLTESENNRVLGVTLRFYQIQYPIVTIGQGGYFDYYQITTRITRRTLE